jgi:hypothetical protein
MVGHQYIRDQFGRPLRFQVTKNLEEGTTPHIFREEWCSIDKVAGYEVKSAW